MIFTLIGHLLILYGMQLMIIQLESSLELMNLDSLRNGISLE